MPAISIKGIARRLRNSWRSAKQGMLYAKRDELNFNSGLGDSAFLLYGIVKALKPGVVVEIGSARGRSTCFIGMALKENGAGKLYAVDPHVKTAWNDQDSVDTFGILENNISTLGLENQVQLVRMTSIELSKTWNREINLLFIDGDHSYEGVNRDWNLFSPFVTKFGVVLFHDTIWDLKPDSPFWRPDMGVPTFVDKLRRDGYPVITLDQDCGLSIVQTIKHGISLAPHVDASIGVNAMTP